MVRRSLWVGFLSCCLLLTVAGCLTVSKAVQAYEECKGDVECLKEMDQVRVSSYVVTKSATNSMPIPSVPEFIALVVSNVVAFVYGVFHGKKKP